MLDFKIIGGLGISNDELQKRKSIKIEVNGVRIESAIKEIVDKYYEVGVREFFLGYIPKKWYSQFGFMNSLNGRFGEKEQIQDINILKEVINYIHTLDNGQGGKCKALLTMNYRYYTDLKMEYIKDVINETKDFIDGYIVGAIEIFEYLKEIQFGGYISLSTILNIYNEYDNRFYIELSKEYGLNLRRSIFPRETTIKEILSMDKQLAEDNKKYNANVITEVFMQGDYCVYANGSCVVGHKMNGSLRDLCSQVFRRGQNVIKSVDYDFIDKLEKNKEIETDLNDKEDIFISSDVFLYINPELDVVISKLNDKEINIDDVKHYITKLYIDFKLNIQKYVWDGMTPATDKHNVYILKIIEFIKAIYENYFEELNTTNQKILEDLHTKINNSKKKGEKHFNTLKTNIGKFGVLAKYKFSLYNRTSLPVVHLLKEMKTLDVLKVPMRGRDANSFKLELDKIQDAVKKPEKYIDEANLTGKYFHYDISYTDVYKKRLKENME